jgi:hypothetical protein
MKTKPPLVTGFVCFLCGDAVNVHEVIDQKSKCCNQICVEQKEYDKYPLFKFAKEEKQTQGE